jgi:HemY protein
MIRWLFVLVALGVAAFGAYWLVVNLGMVSLTWLDFNIETSVAVLVGCVLAFAVLVALVYRFWRSLRGSHGSLRRWWRERRRRRGYEALSRGLVAVAAGDADVAGRQARRAEALVHDGPLTMLLSAQAAQLQGDESAAAAFFTAMRAKRETEFLGIRGLLTQAMKRQDWNEALKLARRAYVLSPKSEWVVKTLYDLQKRTGKWADAEVTLGESVKMKLVSAPDASRERAEMQYRKSLECEGREALDWARKAHRSDPTLVPAAVRLAKLYVAGGSLRKAAAMIETMWETNPDPELAEVYWAARKCDDALKKMQAAQRLATFNPKHEESRITVAVAALEGRLWGEARSNLEPIAGDDASPRVCRLMAELEEAEHGDLARARTWLMRAAGDEHAPQMSSQVPQLTGSPE